MDHSGRAFKLALRQICWGLIAVLALLSAGVVAGCQELSAPDPQTGGAITSRLFLAIAPSEAPWEMIALRFTAGRYPRKTQAWARTGDLLERGQRIGMMQFGSRCELFLPLSAEVQVASGDALRGGETIVACFA